MGAGLAQRLRRGAAAGDGDRQQQVGGAGGGDPLRRDVDEDGPLRLASSVSASVAGSRGPASTTSKRSAIPASSSAEGARSPEATSAIRLPSLRSRSIQAIAPGSGRTSP